MVALNSLLKFFMLSIDIKLVGKGRAHRELSPGTVDNFSDEKNFNSWRHHSMKAFKLDVLISRQCWRVPALQKNFQCTSVDNLYNWRKMAALVTFIFGCSVELSLENLDKIYRVLAVSYEGSNKTLDQMDLNETLEQTEHNREVLNIIFKRMGAYAHEISHVESFLNQSVNVVMTPEQRGIFDECQTVCDKIKKNSLKVLKWVAASRKQWNDSGADSLDESPKETTSIPIETEKGSSESRVSDDMLIVYEQMRDAFKFLYGEFMFVEPEKMMNFAGHELKVMQGKQMFIETEHEMSVLMDYGLFRYKKNGRNVVQRYYDQNHMRYTDHRKMALEIFQHARFSFLTIIQPINKHGVLVRDPLTAEEFVLIDKELNQLIKSTLIPYALLTHYLQTPQFILTTDSSVPVPLNGSVGKDMCRIFARLVNHHQHNEKLSLDTYQDCIKDLYRIVIHEDLAKNVSSRALPMHL